ncbi:MAG: polysaccharide deacetylase family protein [Oscillospiraceae bacterium]|jgi:peptidoglycan/xylan/chitin deacetylase (PgdA/CDA1 family)
MYFGSVRFFKHLIYASLVIVLLLAILSLKLLLNTKGVGTYTPYEQDNSESVNESVNESVDQKSDSTPELQKVRLETAQIEYQSLYLELNNEMPVTENSQGKTAYLTFDDGPSARTLEILDILKERNIKATFFVVTSNSDLEILKRIADEGHTIGIHSHTHKYSQIYRSTEAFLDDFSTCFKKIYEITSVKPQIFRFPGGSINAYNRGIYQDIISEMLRRGYLYYDWNISTQDTVNNITPKKILNNVKEMVRNQDSIIVLGHDSESKAHTVKALPGIIDFLEDKGYSFDKLDNNVPPIVFAYQ